MKAGNFVNLSLISGKVDLLIRNRAKVNIYEAKSPKKNNFLWLIFPKIVHKCIQSIPMVN